MKSIISKAMMLVAFAATLFSFTSNFGGEGFEIFLNGKVLLQQFGKDVENVKTLELDNAAPNDKITIKYYHCGRIGKNRVIAIMDEQDKLLKEWHFSDAGNIAAIGCYVKDLLGLKKSNNTILKLYYSSTELPKGRMLASINTGSNTMASIKK